MKIFKNLIDAAKSIQSQALADYSGFHVGAAVQTASGEIFAGCNIESTSYGLSMCAERVALFKALSEGHSEFTAIAIASDSGQPCPPCGACRQVIWEHCQDIPVILVAGDGNHQTLQMSQLFPHPFDNKIWRDENS